MATKIQVRRDTAANWASVNPTLSAGEWGLETDTGRAKIGDGTTAWATLAYKTMDVLTLATITGGLTAKATPIDADKIGFWDSVTSAMRNFTFANLWTWIQSKINAATNKDALVDADKFAIVDTEASNVTKTTTWANIKAKIWTALGALIAGGANKATIVDADKTSLSDSASTNATKYATAANWFAYISGKLYAWIIGLTAKDTPADADVLHYADTVGTASKKITFANIAVWVLTKIGKSNLATGFTLAGGTTPKTLTVDVDAKTSDIPTTAEKARLAAIEAASGATTADKLGTFITNQFYVSKDYSFDTAHSWLGVGGGVVTQVANSGEFAVGTYYTQLVAPVAACSLYIPITEEFRIVGAKLKIRMKYKSTADVTFRVYFRDVTNTTWVNNAGSPAALVLPASSGEAVFEISRAYEATAGYFVLYINANSTTTLKVGSLRLLGESKVGAYSIRTTNLIVAPSGGDFTTLRAALKSIKDADYYTRYHILVKNGTYNEIDIMGTNYIGDDPSVVVVEGESREGVIIRTDGTSTAISPADYNIAAYKSVAINTIPQTSKHSFYLHETLTIKNLTIHANDVKYCIHQDKSGNYASKLDNCRIIHEETTSDTFANIVGVGSRYGQKQIYQNCIMELRWGVATAPTSDSYAVYWHNWNNQLGVTSFDMQNCECINCGIINVSDLGSGYEDIAKVENCKSNLKDRGIKYALTTGYYTPTPATENDYPYNIHLQVIGGEVNNFVLATNRLAAGYKALALNDYHTPIYNSTVSTIEQGTAVKIDYAASAIAKKSIVKASDNTFDFVLWSDVATLSDGFGVKKGKTVNVRAVAAVYTKGGMLKINSSGLFDATSTQSECVACILETKTLGATGLLLATLV